MWKVVSRKSVYQRKNFTKFKIFYILFFLSCFLKNTPVKENCYYEPKAKKIKKNKIKTPKAFRITNAYSVKTYCS